MNIIIDRNDIAINEIIEDSLAIKKNSRINEKFIDKSDSISISRVDQINDIKIIPTSPELIADAIIIS